VSEAQRAAWARPIAARLMELAIIFSAYGWRDWNQLLRLWFIPPLN
jgi:hypothetical protein